MSAAIAMPGNTAATFLTHFFGPGLADDRYVVEKFRALADGNIRRCSDPAPKGQGQDHSPWEDRRLKTSRKRLLASPFSMSRISDSTQAASFRALCR